jgi:hypothetical protein
VGRQQDRIIDSAFSIVSQHFWQHAGADAAQPVRRNYMHVGTPNRSFGIDASHPAHDKLPIDCYVLPKWHRLAALI